MAYPFLREPIRTKDTDSGRGSIYEYAVSTCQGWRNTQEDVHLVLPQFDIDTSLFAVFDGHNGIEVAAYAGKHLPNYILSNPSYRRGQIVEGLKEAFLELDKSIKANVAELQAIRSLQHPNLRVYVEPGHSSGCTAVVCLLRNDTFYCANIGDSRCILNRNGSCIPLSYDHNPDVPSEYSRIVNAGGNITQGRINSVINVSRAFGDHLFKENKQLSVSEQMIIALPDVVVEKFQRKNDKFIVLMCDGIWNSMSNADIIEYVQSRISSSVPLTTITEEIINNILPDQMRIETGIKGKDNMTVLVVKFDSTEDRLID